MTKYTLLIEIYPAIALEVCANARALRDHHAKSGHSRRLCQDSFCCLGKRIEQAFDDLEQGKVGVAQGIADEMRVAVGIGARIVSNQSRYFCIRS